MTAIQADHPVRRETGLYRRGRALVVILHPGYIMIRQKGRRSGYTVDYGAIYDLAGKMQAAADRAEKLARKKKP